MLLGQPEWEGQSYKPLVQLNWTAASLGTHFFRLAWDPIPSRAIKQHREQDFKELPYRLVARYANNVPCRVCTEQIKSCCHVKLCCNYTNNERINSLFYQYHML